MVVAFSHRKDLHLRILTIATVLPLLALVLVFGLSTFQDIPIVALVPLAMSALLGANTLIRRRTSNVWRTCADISIAAMILAYLITK
jgi:hypothetical protein